MRIAVTGARGRLGHCLIERGHYPLDCDISDRAAVAQALEHSKPDVIINCAAYTWVDGCEDIENRDVSMAVNLRGPGILRTEFDGHFVQLSTGFVFDGKHGPYDEEDVPHPISWYGWSKLGGEVSAGVRQPTLVARVLDLFGPGPKSDFVRSIRDVLELGQPYDLPKHLYGTPTYIPHLVDALIWAIEREITGVLNLGGNMVLSRSDWGKTIAEAFGHDPDLIRGTKEIKGDAPRPLRGGLLVDHAIELGAPIHSPVEGLNLIAEGEENAETLTDSS